MKLIATIIFCVFNILSCFGQKVNGITMVASPDTVSENAYIKIQKVNADWIALVPYAFMRKGEPIIKYNQKKQWWGETLDGLQACITDAQKHHLNVMIKPQLYIHQSWTGDIDFTTAEEWKTWESSYTEYIMTMAKLAAKNKIGMFCIGTELRQSCIKRPQFWNALIAQIRNVYKGKLTYSANWDDYNNVPFWTSLDYIGISAYFPLTEMTTPTFNTLKIKWQPYIKSLKKLSDKHKKQILLTEYGYLTTDQCAWKCWELEKQLSQLPENQQAQANAFEALYKTLWSQPFVAGGFIWKWYPDGKGHEGQRQKDYDPQNKTVESIIKMYYKAE